MTEETSNDQDFIEAIDSDEESASELAGSEPVAEKEEKKSLFDLLHGVIVKPTSTFKYVSAKKSWVAGALIYLLSTWIGVIAGLPAQIENLKQLQTTVFSESSFVIFAVIFMVLVLPFILEFGLFFTGGIYHILAKLFKGNGSYAGIIASLGFASFPQVLLTPLSLLFFVEGSVGKIIAMLISFSFSSLLSIWVLVLNIFAVRENYKLSTARAAAVCLIPIAAVIIISVFLAVLLIALIAGSIDLNQQPYG
jgi:hypothetical protein